MSTLNVDALVGNTSANAITVRGEGSATTSLQQGLAKAWINFDGKGTASVSDSFNHSSLTDVAVGQFNNTLASALGNINYSLTATLGRSPNAGGTDPAFAYMADDAFTPTSTAYRVFSTGMNATGLQDHDRNFNAVHGDLA
jgi:hypothetical protein